MGWCAHDAMRRRSTIQSHPAMQVRSSRSCAACIADEEAGSARARSGGPAGETCGATHMDSLITAAARALAAGDPLGALKRVALREDAPALALRGIAMAQLGDFVRARSLVRRAARSFGSKEPVPSARCIVAEAEIALAARDLNWPSKMLDAARDTLDAHGD